MARKGGNPETYFKSTHPGKLTKKAYGAKMPEEIGLFLDELECYSEYVREAVMEKYQREKKQQQ